MKQRAFFSVVMLLASVSIAVAGTINKGVWSPAGCKAEPAAPVIDGTNEDAFNKSVQAFNAWQKEVGAYNTCVVKEANDDNAAIATSANALQKKLQDSVEKLHKDAEAAKAKLEAARPK